MPQKFFEKEGIEDTRKGITKIVKDLSISQIRRLISPFSFALGIDLWPIIYGWIKKKRFDNEVFSNF